MVVSRVFSQQQLTNCVALLVLAALFIGQPSSAATPQNTIADIRKLGLTSQALVEKSIADINRLDRSGPTLNSVVEINPEALQLAKQLDGQAPLSSLHGLPVLLKDNIDTGDKMQTTAGSLALLGTPAPEDAHLVKRLRSAGVLILGKTNLSEWANFRSSQSISGWSARGGQTKNPHVLDRSPCGSSSGSAVAVAAGIVPLAVGTETDGSILCPSAMNGIVGIKPTRGLVSRSGIVPLSHSQDTAGPMARTVADAAALLAIMAGSDPNDESTELADQHQNDYQAYLKTDYLRGKRIGVLINKQGLHAGTDAIFEMALKSFDAAGAVLIDDLSLPHQADIGEPEFTVLLHDFKHDINRYLGLRPNLKVSNLAELIAFNERHARKELAYFDQSIFIKAEQTSGVSHSDYTNALEKSRHYAGSAGIDALMQEHGLDALVAPAYTPAFLIDPVFGDSFGYGNSSPAAVSGYPSITVPAGFDHHLPVGIVLMASQWQDGELIGMAYAFEQQHQAYKPPGFLPTLQIDR
ncbi:amidase [Halioxenophilus aromaticivorans]|uniref:Amidase n=1 Tax=Halioxenophilus aromaticivorans TaxID=1306992 RepID=A0AAV3TXK6_9ALTE